jgi:putative ABC transport system ATP-binding protein
MATTPAPSVLPPSVLSLDLTVRPGEFVAVLGAPGSGKSALLALAASRMAGSGDVAHVPQDADTALDPLLTAAESIALPLELSGTDARSARRLALTILFEMELGEVAERRPTEISRAHRKAVTVARALAGQRRLLLADEPTDGLDGELADTVLALLRMRRPVGAAVLMTTRDPDHAAWADRVVPLREMAPASQAV